MTPGLEEDKKGAQQAPWQRAFADAPTCSRGQRSEWRRGGGGVGDQLLRHSHVFIFCSAFHPSMWLSFLWPFGCSTNQITLQPSDPSPCSHTGLIPLLHIGFGFGSLLQVKLTRNKKDKPFRRFQWSTYVQLSNNKECV